ncbi:DUF6634 family protein [Cereibacter sphaeroides]|uniref:DUF6634 family protein n=1 Tax=Cereibacter sphaeroides TaxID=1063 RepID=UPI001F37E83E|nr:DUF6634 family protein [Cereibacter sphaeroides]MCE6968811.1 hypothetical protein [Cereibacter sphaeroides]
MNPEDHLLLDQCLAANAPPEAQRSEAVLLDVPDPRDWQPILTLGDVPLLWGRVRPHPRFGDATITGSPRIALGAHAGWGGTVSRGHQLCAPSNAAGQAAAHDAAPNPDNGRTLDRETRGLVLVDDPELLARWLALRIQSIRGLAKGAHPH